MFTPSGSYVAMLTPMNADESLRLGEIANQVRRFVRAGIDGLFCLGTNGEFYALTPEEKVRVIDSVLGAAEGRRPVCAGVGCVTTRETVALARQAERMGVTFVSVIAPYFVAASAQELERHFRAVAESVSLPVVLYNIPARTGNTIAPESVARLAGISNIVGIKDSSGKIESVKAFLGAAPPGFSVLCGTDSLILDALRAGASGAISGLANIVPAVVARICSSWRSADQTSAEEAQAELTSLRSITALGNPNTVVKRAVGLLGYDVGPAREPVATVDAEHEGTLHAALERSPAARAEMAISRP